MGDVNIIYKIMPDGLEVDLGKVKQEVQAIASQYGDVKGMEEKPVAFGLKAVMISIVMPDKTANPEELEGKLEAVEGVQSVNTESLSLI